MLLHEQIAEMLFHGLAEQPNGSEILRRAQMLVADHQKKIVAQRVFQGVDNLFGYR